MADEIEQVAYIWYRINLYQLSNYLNPAYIFADPGLNRDHPGQTQSRTKKIPSSLAVHFLSG